MKGAIKKKPISFYPCAKVLSAGEEKLCFIEVYPLRVTLEAVIWREQAERKRAWFRAEEAASLVDEGGLALIIDEFR